ncbi:MAG: LysR family transcriptional regulator [Oligoflexia bacterium]|nr:LysR family transcriptional regulator [Oligoflexia bacterium]
MDYRYLKTFIVTAQKLSFSKAAQQLGIAQSAVSRQIRLLEESIGKTLLVRTTSKVFLTGEGKKLLGEFLLFENRINEFLHEQDITTIKIGIVHGILENWALTKIDSLKKRFPQIIRFSVNSGDSLHEGLINGLYDITISTDNIQNEAITSLRLFDEKLAIVSASPIKVSSLHQYTWIVYGASDWLHRFFKKQSDSFIEVNSITSILKLVKKNEGIAILPDHMLNPSDKLYTYPLKRGKQQVSSIYLNTLNYQIPPQNIKDAISIFREK